MRSRGSWRPGIVGSWLRRAVCGCVAAAGRRCAEMMIPQARWERWVSLPCWGFGGKGGNERVELTRFRTKPCSGKPLVLVEEEGLSPFGVYAVAKLAEYRMYSCASLIRAIAYSATANHNEIGVACHVVKPPHASSSSATAISAGKGRSARSEGENKLLDYQFTTVLHFFGVQTRQYSCS